MFPRAMAERYVGAFGGTANWRGTPYGPPSLEVEGKCSAEDAMRIRVRFGERHNSWEGELALPPTATLGQLKARLSDIHAIAPEMQVLRLSATEDALEDDAATLASLGIGNGSRIRMSVAAVMMDGTSTALDREAFMRNAAAKAEAAAVAQAAPVGLWANHNVGGGSSSLPPPANLWAQHEHALRK